MSQLLKSRFTGRESDVDGLRALVEQPCEEMAETLLLQCDVRDILTPALLAADLLCKHTDPAVVKRAETVVEAITRVVARLG